jgi:hypothetical protein
VYKADSKQKRMQRLPRAPSIFDDDFGRKPSDVGVHYASVGYTGGGDRPLVGIEIKSTRRTDYYVGKDDAHVVAVQLLIDAARADVSRVMGKFKLSGAPGYEVFEAERAPPKASKKKFETKVELMNYRITISYSPSKSQPPMLDVTALMEGQKRPWKVLRLVPGEFSGVPDRAIPLGMGM